MPGTADCREYGDDVTPPASARPLPRRRAAASSLRRASRIVLIIGTAISLLSAFGPTWANRIGMAVALSSAILACTLAWRELAQARHEHAKQLLTLDREHGRQLADERRRNADVVSVLTSRISDRAVVIEAQKLTIAQLKAQLYSARKDTVSLSAELGQRNAVIDSLRVALRNREAELLALLADGNDAEVHALPRRASADHGPVASNPEGTSAGVVDLATVEAKVLPNFEGTRKLA
jgi:thiamine pyrophosphate-dependent acetolactate synthase large subunit-like protein